MIVRYGLLCLLGLTFVGSAIADPPAPAARPFWQRLWPTQCPPVGCCPDDYCRKPMPCVSVPPFRGCADDYCLKPLPCVLVPPACGMRDDYCRKLLPCLWCPTWSPFMQCGSSDNRCVNCNTRR